MIDIKACEWLLENAGAAIRYRVLHELLRDEAGARGAEAALIDDPQVKLWLRNLKPESPPQHWSMEHGSFDF
jgi:hypothetical protein